MEMGVSKHFEKYSGLMLGRLALSCLIICVFSAAHAEEKLVDLEAEERPVVVNLKAPPMSKLVFCCSAGLSLMPLSDGTC